MVDKAYKPYGDVGNIKNTEIKIDKPDYPDVGVSFAGFSKSLYQGDEYRLNPQSAYRYELLNGADWPPLLRINFIQGKKFFVTSIVMICSSDGTGVGFEKIFIQDLNAKRICAISNQCDNSGRNTTSYYFPVALDFGSAVDLVISHNHTDERIVQFFGWTE